MWLDLFLLTTIASLLLLVPGMLISFGAGVRGFWRIGLAPVLSVGVISLSAVLSAKAGISWNLITVFMSTLGLALASFLVSYFGSKLLPTYFSGKSSDKTEFSVSRKFTISTVAGVAISSLVMIKNVLFIFNKPDAFSQTYDNIFHLNLIRWMLDTGIASSLDVGMSGNEAFYPSAWHDLAVLSLKIANLENVSLGNNAAIIATLVVAWPLTSMLLMRVIFPPKPIIPLLGGIMSVAFTAFPLLPIGYGVLYPNFLAVSILPAMVALTVNLFHLNRGSSLPTGSTVLLGLIGGIGLTLAHPNATVGLICVIASGLALTVVVGKLFNNIKFKGPKCKSVLLSAVILLMGILDAVIYFVLSATRSSMWPVSREFAHALGEILLVMPRGEASNVLAGLLTCTGAYFILKQRKYLWLLLVHAGFCFIWAVMVSYKPSLFRNLISGPWYGDGVRVGCLMVVTAIPISVFGAYELLLKGSQFLTSQSRFFVKINFHGSYKVAYLIIVLLGTQLFGMPGIIYYLQGCYSLGPNSRLVDKSEYKLIMEVPEIVPKGESVVVNPWNGSSMLYAFTGVETTEKHVTPSPSSDQQLINDHLDDASKFSRVCRVLSEENAKWVLDFSNEPLVNSPNLTFPGFDDLDDNPGFMETARVGDAVLYRITACG